MTEHTTATVTDAELRSFQPRVGRSPQARLQWALDFCRRDLGTLTQGDWFNLRREFLAFSAVTITPDALDAPWIHKAIAGEPWMATWAASAPPRGARGPARGTRQGARLSAGVEGRHPGWPLPSPESLRDIQRHWRDKIVAPLLEPGRVIWAGPFELRVFVDRLDTEGRSRIDFTLDKPDPTARLPLLTLLGAFAHRLRACPEPSCQRWFVTRRRGQTFCGRTCQNRATIRAWRARLPGPQRSSTARGRKAHKRPSGAQ